MPHADSPNSSLDTVATARLAAAVADDRKATDVLILDVSRILAITDMFVIATASNRRLVRTVAEMIEERLKSDAGRSPLRTEGLSEQQWVLLDYGDVIVHVFATEMRAFYEIERLYRDAPKMSWEPFPVAAASSAPEL